jgi:hypothetical protein
VLLESTVALDAGKLSVGTEVTASTKDPVVVEIWLPFSVSTNE